MVSAGAATLIFCLSLCVLAVHTAEQMTSGKSKRDVSGLFPFPRVGRGGAWTSSQYFGPQEAKRQGLIPFPRVGRAEGGKRDVMHGGSGGMWFGPRLGRLQKRDIANGQTGWTLLQIRDFPASRLRPIMKENFTPRLGRDSSEEYQKDEREDSPREGAEPLAL